MERKGKVDWKADRLLAVGVIILWSIGRIINPIRHLVTQNNGSIGYPLGFFEVVYVFLHGVLVVYVVTLLARFFKRNGSTVRWETLGELALYVYVLVTLLLSLYFIAFEFGYLPPVLAEFLQPFVTQ